MPTTHDISPELAQAVAITSELCGRTFSGAAALVFCEDLAQYPEAAVMGALKRCRKEVRGVLTVSDVVSRLEDGRPGPEEAWSMMPMHESQSVVWTPEMAKAFGVALPLLHAGDAIAARMAFKEAYTKAVSVVREVGMPVTWQASLGHDAQGRKPVLEAAVKDGRLTLAQAKAHYPALEATGPGLQIAHEVQKALAA